MIRIKSLPIFLLLITTFVSAQDSVFKNFITAKDGKLMDGDKEFRFISFNIPNLNYVEDEFDYSVKHPYRMPDEFEITDALESIKQLGGRAVRIYTIPVRNIKEEPYPTYVLEPGKFDEDSFKAMDLMMALANKIGIRIIVPFVNNWKWMGGRPQYADFRSKHGDEFWSDSLLIEDVKATIDYVINRKNSITGIQYKDDKAILCWETGNELYSTPGWTKTICRYIKSLDSNHLVMDGYNAIDGIPVQNESLEEPSVDIVSTHHYETDPAKMIEHIEQTAKMIDGKKVYIAGEFGFLSTTSLEQVLNTVIKNKVAGAMIWSLRHHRKEGGFYWHSEPLGGGIYKAYHWPGFPSGIEYDEINLLNMMQKKAFEIQGLPVSKVEVPKAPRLLLVQEVSHISWQGSVGASTYDVERATSINGPWIKTGYDISDAETQYFSLFNDETAEIGEQYFYRVIAKNSAGKSEPSNIIGPVKVERKCLVDDMKNYGTLYHKQGNVTLATDNDRMFREKMFRLNCDPGSEVTYAVNGIMNECRVYAFSEKEEATIEFYTSVDNVEFKKVDTGLESLFAGKEFYDYWVPCTYKMKFNEDEKARFVKIVIKAQTQIARVEIFYK